MMKKIYIYKNKNGNITAEKNINDLWSLFQNTKNIFGNGYISKKILDFLTYKQVLEIKKEIKNKIKGVYNVEN